MQEFRTDPEPAPLGDHCDVDAVGRLGDLGEGTSADQVGPVLEGAPGLGAAPLLARRTLDAGKERPSQCGMQHLEPGSGHAGHRYGLGLVEARLGRHCSSRHAI